MSQPGKYCFRRARRAHEFLQFRIQRRIVGIRLDVYLADRFEGYSRTFFQDLIRRGKVLVNRLPARPSHKVAAGEEITVFLPRGSAREPYAVPLDIIYQDRWLLALNKPAGMVVHPARGHVRDTLLNALFHHFREEMAAAAGFHIGTVHRLDIDTSGAILFALDERAHHQLQQAFETRQVKKTYLCLVHGSPAWERREVKAALGVDANDRKKVAVDGWNARPAHTGFEVLARGRSITLLRACLHTGRSHQIRVHAAHIGHPVVADETYGGCKHSAAGEFLTGRQALHSEALEFEHPESGRRMRIRAGLPADMRELLARTVGAASSQQPADLAVSDVRPRQTPWLANGWEFV